MSSVPNISLAPAQFCYCGRERSEVATQPSELWSWLLCRTISTLTPSAILISSRIQDPQLCCTTSTIVPAQPSYKLKMSLRSAGRLHHGNHASCASMWGCCSYNKGFVGFASRPPSSTCTCFVKPEKMCTNRDRESR